MALAAELARFIEGTPELSVDDVVDVTAIVILLGGKSDDPREGAVLAEFAGRAGIDAALAPEAIGERITAYFEGRSSLALVDALARLLREDLAAGGGEGARSLGAVIGRMESTRAILGGGVRPEGTVPAGPAARFVAARKLDDER